MLSPQVVFMMIVLVIVALIFVYTSTDYYIVRKKLRKGKRKRIADFEDGNSGKIMGEVVYHGRTLTAPLSGRKCVYYHIVVKEQRGAGNNSRMEEIINEEKAGDVIVKEGDAYAFVDQQLVYTYIVKDVHLESGFLKDADSAMEAYLRKHRHKSEGDMGFNKYMTYHEGVLEAGEKVVVAGKGKWRSRDHFRFQVPAEKILHLRAEGEDALYLSDDISVG